jgi:aldehyde:ferredoxin oxidoreductase
MRNISGKSLETGVRGKGRMKYENARLENGYANRILAIEVGSGAIAAQGIDPEVRDYFTGGRSLGLYLLHRSITPQTRAHDPENPLVFANGPLGGIPQFPGTAKAMAMNCDYRVFL